MGNFMIPVCCVCGRSAKIWNDNDWYNSGGRQDFCPSHASDRMEEYMVDHIDPLAEAEHTTTNTETKQ